MTDAPAITVYANLIKMLEYRRLVPGENAALTPAQAADKLNHVGYIKITASRGPAADSQYYACNSTIVLIAPDSNLGKKSANFQRLLKYTLPAVAPVSVGVGTTTQATVQATAQASANAAPANAATATQATVQEIMFVSSQEFTTYLDKILTRLREERPRNFYIESRTYTVFAAEHPRHVMVPPHIVPPQSEVDRWCALMHVTPRQFQRIRQDDPQAVWLGLRPGMVVKIQRISETAGEAPAWRLCE